MSTSLSGSGHRPDGRDRGPPHPDAVNMKCASSLFSGCGGHRSQPAAGLALSISAVRPTVSTVQGEQVIAVLVVLAVAVVIMAFQTRSARSDARAARSDARTAQERADAAHQELVDAVENHETALRERGRVAARSSRSTFDGHVAEHAFPYAADHSYHPKDIVHVGGVIDFLVFDGLFEIRQGLREPEELTVVLADVKYGSSGLSTEQRAVIVAMNEGRTRGECWKVRENEGRLAYQSRPGVTLRPSGRTLDVGKTIIAGGMETTLGTAEAVRDRDIAVPPQREPRG